MMERCNVDRDMAPAAQTLIQMIDRLLTRLFEYRSVRAMSDCLENVMSRTVELLVSRVLDPWHNPFVKVNNTR